MNNVIFFPAILERPTGMKDNTMKFSVMCNEMPPEKLSQVFALNNKYIYIAIKEETFLNEELSALAELESDETIGKSHSHRLKNVLFVGWKNNPEGFLGFDQYYQHKMEVIINHLKSKLPEK